MYYFPKGPSPALANEQDVGGQEGYPPIKLNSRLLVCENTVFSVFFDHLSDAKGREVLEYLSIMPKCSMEGRVTGIGVLPVKDGRIGLIKVFRHPIRDWSWEIPKGFLDADENAEQAAARELFEETGFSIQAGQLVALGQMSPEAGVIDGRIRLFSATLEKGETVDVAGELGHGELFFFGRGEIVAMLESGDIQDGCTMSAILKLAISERWSEITDEI